MVLLITTPTIVAALHALSPSARDQLNLAQTPPEIGAPISHDEVVSLAHAFTSPQQEENDMKEKEKENGGKRYTLNELLRGSDVYTPPAAKKAEPVRLLSFFFFLHYTLSKGLEERERERELIR
jgi:hypothetical protein